jgi:nucleotide-binding universal stress UspA family protein
LITCGVDGSPSALEGVRQAAALADAHSTIELVAITDEWGIGPTAGALLTETRAAKALEEASAEIAASPARILSRTAKGLHAARVLLQEADGTGLLVVGRHGFSRLGGILAGSTATKVLHNATMPVLVASKPPEGHEFPGRILVAADGPDHPELAVRLAGEISALSGGDITLLRVDWSRRAKRPELAEAVASITELTGAKPVEIIVGGNPHRMITDYAAREGASLVVTGSRDLKALGAMRSVSERVAHEAACSVLVVHRNA